MSCVLPMYRSVLTKMRSKPHFIASSSAWMGFAISSKARLRVHGKGLHRPKGLIMWLHHGFVPISDRQF